MVFVRLHHQHTDDWSTLHQFYQLEPRTQRVIANNKYLWRELYCDRFNGTTKPPPCEDKTWRETYFYVASLAHQFNTYTTTMTRRRECGVRKGNRFEPLDGGLEFDVFNQNLFNDGGRESGDIVKDYHPYLTEEERHHQCISPGLSFLLDDVKNYGIPRRAINMLLKHTWLLTVLPDSYWNAFILQLMSSVQKSCGLCTMTSEMIIDFIRFMLTKPQRPLSQNMCGGDTNALAVAKFIKKLYFSMGRVQRRNTKPFMREIIVWFTGDIDNIVARNAKTYLILCHIQVQLD